MNNEYDYCRLCAKLIFKTQLLNIKSNNLNFESKLLLFRLHINENDNFPKTVCGVCEGKINNFYEFCKQILEAQCFFESNFYHLSDIKPEINFKNEDANNYVEEDILNEFSIGDIDIKSNLTTVDKMLVPTDCKIEDENVENIPLSKRLFNIEEIRHKYKEFMKEWQWLCQDCTETFQSEDELSEHYTLIHNKSIRYKCIECNKCSNTEIKFWKHIENHMKKTNHRCDICKTFLSSATKLKNHVETYHQSAGKRYHCNICDKYFLKENILKLHRRTHEENPNSVKDRQYKCDECDKLFLSIYTLRNHKKSHVGIREHICEHCGKRFWLKKYLIDHVKSHNQDRPYKCDLCSASFKVKMYLRKHRFLHTGIKKFQCDICGKKFPRKHGLDQHSVTHSESYPFECDVCNRRFKTKRNYLGHQRTHTGEKPYSCTDCNKHFACAVSYDAHMEKNHGVIKVKKTFIEIKIDNNNIV